MSAPATAPSPTVPTLAPGEVQTSITLEQSTVGDVGNVLPVSGLRFELRPPNIRTRKLIGNVGSTPDAQKYFGRGVATYLGIALSKLGDVDLSEMKVEAAALEVARLPIADVFTIMLAWKHAGHPKGASMGSGSCGSCNAPFADVLVRLCDLELSIAPEGTPRENLIACVGLEHGFPYPAGKVVHTVAVRPPTWLDSFWHLGTAGWKNAELLRACTLRAAIFAVDTAVVPGKLPESAIDELLPDDQALIDDALARITPTPNMQITVECPGCGAENMTSIDWMNPDFFGSSRRA